MTLESTIKKLAQLATDVAHLVFVNDNETNLVRPPATVMALLSPNDPLEELYQLCDGMTFASVHVGYFVESSQRYATASARDEPHTLVSDKSEMIIHVFGSDGGGGRFAVNTTGEVYYLPSGGGVIDGRYWERPRIKARMIAPTVEAFFGRLRTDVEAFIAGDSHAYVV